MMMSGRFDEDAAAGQDTAENMRGAGVAFNQATLLIAQRAGCRQDIDRNTRHANVMDQSREQGLFEAIVPFRVVAQ